MDKLKFVKLELPDGSYSESIPLSAEAEFIDINGETLTDNLNKKPYYYNNVASMKNDISLKAGDMVITLGYHSANDGGGAKYKIVSNGGDIQLNNSLFAKVINEIENNYNENFIYSRERYYDTDCYFITIPKYDNNGDIINPYVATSISESPNIYARNNFTTITANAGLTYQNASGTWKQGIVIGKGRILNEAASDITYRDDNVYIGLTEDRRILEYQANITTAQQMLNDGIKDAFLVFYRYMNNGELEEHADVPNWTIASPRMDFGIKGNGDIVILACDGRTDNNIGLDNEQAFAIMLSKGCVRAWRGDGGGSTSLNIKGIKMNRNIDDNATTDREILVTFNLKNSTLNNEIAKLYSKIGEIKQALNRQIRLDFENRFQKYPNSIMYASNVEQERNVIQETGVWQPLSLMGRYRHGEKIKGILNDVDQIGGFHVDEATLVKIDLNMKIEITTEGERRVRLINKNTGAIVQYWTFCRIIKDAPENSGNKEVVPLDIVMLLNNSTIGTEYEFQVQGQQGDKITYINLILETKGSAV